MAVAQPRRSVHSTGPMPGAVSAADGAAVAAAADRLALPSVRRSFEGGSPARVHRARTADGGEVVLKALAAHPGAVDGHDLDSFHAKLRQVSRLGKEAPKLVARYLPRPRLRGGRRLGGDHHRLPGVRGPRCPAAPRRLRRRRGTVLRPQRLRRAFPAERRIRIRCLPGPARIPGRSPHRPIPTPPAPHGEVLPQARRRARTRRRRASSRPRTPAPPAPGNRGGPHGRARADPAGVSRTRRRQHLRTCCSPRTTMRTATSTSSVPAARPHHGTRCSGWVSAPSGKAPTADTASHSGAPCIRATVRQPTSTWTAWTRRSRTSSSPMTRTGSSACRSPAHCTSSPRRPAASRTAISVVKVTVHLEDPPWSGAVLGRRLSPRARVREPPR